MANLLDKASILLTPTAYDNGSMLSVKPTNGDGDFTFSRNGDASRVNSSGIIVTEGANLPRINYENGCGSYILEDESTNLITYSEDFSQGIWSKNSVTLTSGQVSPSGDTSAFKISGSGGSSFHNVNVRLSTNNSIISCFVKKGTLKYFEFIDTIDGAPFTTAQYNLEEITANINIAGKFSNPKIKDYGNGWYRCSVEAAATQTIHFNISKGSTDGIGTIGTDDYLYIWGAQLEQQSFATSYIPTSGATSTRLQDIANGSGNSTLINSTEGTLYFEGATLVNSGSNRYISLLGGSSRISILFRELAGIIRVNGTGFSNIEATGISQDNNNKIAVSYSASGIKLFINGVLKDFNTDNPNFSNNSLNSLDFDLNGSLPFYGKTKALAVYKEALTDAELTALTTI